MKSKSREFQNAINFNFRPIDWWDRLRVRMVIIWSFGQKSSKCHCAYKKFISCPMSNINISIWILSFIDSKTLLTSILRSLVLTDMLRVRLVIFCLNCQNLLLVLVMLCALYLYFILKSKFWENPIKFYSKTFGCEDGLRVSLAIMAYRLIDE